MGRDGLSNFNGVRKLFVRIKTQEPSPEAIKPRRLRLTWLAQNPFCFSGFSALAEYPIAPELVHFVTWATFGKVDPVIHPN